MLQPKEITVKAQDGTDKKFTISKFPAIAGREIICQYPVTAMPKVGDYQVNEEVMIKLMSYVAVDHDGGKLPLTTRALIDNHVPDWETLAKIEVEMMSYNCSFFQNGKISGFFDTIQVTVQQLISSTLTDLLGQLSQVDKQPSKN